MANFETVEFPSKDGLTITGDLYRATKPLGMILLCHRSHCNRGEYRQTAPKLNQMGFSCLAIDQRSGMNIFRVVNETSTRAKKKKLPTGYLDARPDIEAGIDFASDLNRKRPIFLLGSSYSASLALVIAVANNRVRAVVAFSPGEFLKGVKVAEEIQSLKKPAFVTSAKKEIADTRNIVRLIPKKYVTLFEPTVDGFHGSKTLWESVPGYEIYWAALEKFLLKQAGQRA